MILSHKITKRDKHLEKSSRIITFVYVCLKYLVEQNPTTYTQIILSRLLQNSIELIPLAFV